MNRTVQGREGADVYKGHVVKDWIDVNNHMNVAYYVLAFDLGVDALWSGFGITDEYIQTKNWSTFAVESHVTYKRELKLDDPFIITSQVIAYDAKRVHQFQRMYHADEGFLAATAEWMNLHVDLALRRVTPWPDPILENIYRFVEQQGSMAPPQDLGHTMKIQNPLNH